MKSLFLKIAFCIVLAGALFGAAVFAPTASGFALASIVNKRDMVRKYAHKRKIIVLGGSSALVGIDPIAISGATGLPTLDMGLFAGFGLEFQVALIMPYLQKGDLVVLSPEYPVLWGTMETESVARPWCLMAMPKYTLGSLYRYPKDIPDLLVDLCKIAQSKILAIPTAVVSHKPGDKILSVGFLHYAFTTDSLGASDPDIFRQLPDSLREGYRQRYGGGTLSKNSQVINRLQATVATTGAGAIFVWPPFPTQELELNRDLVEPTRKSLSLKVFGEPDDFAYDYGFFSNTVNHLTKVGRIKRTGLLIHLLKTELATADANLGTSGGGIN